MKNIIALCAVLFCSSQLFAETIKLKITYNGNAVVGHHVTVSSAGGAGTGTTDSNGELSVSVGSLAHKSVNLNGKKTCENGEKTWELKGYVTLDGNNFAHVKMEEPLNEMAGEMGLSADMLAGGWGLLCSGPSKSSSDAGGSTTATPETKAEPEPKTRAEILADKKDGINNSMALQENKIAKRNKKLNNDSGKFTEQDKAMLQLEIEELETKLVLNQIELDAVDRELANGSLNKADRTEFKTRKEEAKSTLSANKDSQKALKAEMKSGQDIKSPSEAGGSEPEVAQDPNADPLLETPEPSVSAEEVATPLTDKDISRLKMERSSTKMKLKSLNAELNMKESSLQKKIEKGSLDENEIDTRKLSIELTKKKIADKELKIKTITEQVGE